MARIHGKGGRLSLSPTSGGAVQTVLSLDKWDIDLQADEVDVTAFEDPNYVYVIGLPKIAITFTGFYDTADTTLFAARAASLTGIPINAELQPDVVNNAGLSATGPGFVSVKLEVGAKEAAKVSGKVTPSGGWAINF